MIYHEQDEREAQPEGSEVTAHSRVMMNRVSALRELKMRETSAADARPEGRKNGST